MPRSGRLRFFLESFYFSVGIDTIRLYFAVDIDDNPYMRATKCCSTQLPPTLRVSAKTKDETMGEFICEKIGIQTYRRTTGDTSKEAEQKMAAALEGTNDHLGNCVTWRDGSADLDDWFDSYPTDQAYTVTVYTVHGNCSTSSATTNPEYPTGPLRVELNGDSATLSDHAPDGISRIVIETAELPSDSHGNCFEESEGSQPAEGWCEIYWSEDCETFQSNNLYGAVEEADGEDGDVDLDELAADEIAALISEVSEETQHNGTTVYFCRIADLGKIAAAIVNNRREA